MQLQIKAVLITDKEGRWIIHGCSDETPAQAFKQLSNIWNFDPLKEVAVVVDLPLTIGEAPQPTPNGEPVPPNANGVN
jgi:hypothetical protein